MACNFTINELLHSCFSRILTANFTWKLSEQLFLRTPFPPEFLNWLLPLKAATESCSGKKGVLRCVFSKKVRCSVWSLESAGPLAKLWIYFLHENSWIPWKKNLFFSLLNWPEKRDLPKNTAQRLLLCIIIKVAYPGMERIWTK